MELTEKLFFWFCTFTASALGSVIAYWVSRHKAFESEKGKNLATKEDLADITKIAEKAKNLATKEDIGAITKEVEAIKSQLLFSTQSKLSLAVEERNAVVQCYEKYSYWLNLISETYISNMEGKPEQIQAIRIKIQDSYFQYCISFSRVKIFIDSPELETSFLECAETTLTMQHAVIENLIEYEDILKNMDIENKYLTDSLLTESNKKFYQQILDLVDTFNHTKEEHYALVNIKDDVLVSGIFLHLKALIEN